MRYYDLTIEGRNVEGGKVHFTSHPNGINNPPDPGALDIEFDIQVFQLGTPGGAGSDYISIRGVPLNYLSQSVRWGNISLNSPGATVTLLGGMGKGLPLAKPKQAGLLLSGEVWQSFGNWIGLNQGLTIIPYGCQNLSSIKSGNFSFNLPANESLQTGLSRLFSSILPKVKIKFMLSETITFPQTLTHVCDNLQSFSEWLANATFGWGGKIPGIGIYVVGGQIVVWDGLSKSSPKQLDFDDLIGQPTWFAQDQLMVTTVMRSDISIGDIIKMPVNDSNNAGFVNTSFTSYPSQENYKLTFQGEFQVVGVRHIGSFRSIDGAQWQTNFQCAAINV